MTRMSLARMIQYRTARAGRSATIWVAAAAGSVAVGTMMMPVGEQPDRATTSLEAEPMPPSDQAASIPTSHDGSVQDANNAIGIPKKLPAKASITDSATAPLGTAESLENDRPDSSTDISTSAPTLQPSLKELSADANETSLIDRSQVDVYYATDRRSILPKSFAFWSPVVIPATIICIGTIVALFGLWKSHVRWLWSVASAAGLVLCCLMGVKIATRYQQADKLTKLGGIFFDGSRNDTVGINEVMSYGLARITLPPDHEAGQVERPSLLRFEFAEDVNKHVVIRNVRQLDKDSFFENLDGSIVESKDKSILLFIHGYNVGFEDALRRTAQVASDLRFDGVPMLYSWPSAGKLSGYVTDEATVDWSVVHLEQLVLDLRERTKAESIHVLVHSMGNRVLLGAAERLTLRYPSEQPMLSQVILAAPDVDLSLFQSRYKTPIEQVSQGVTLYTSKGDRALLASMAVHGYQRLGLTFEGMPTFAGIDSVDVSELDTSLLGHSYYGSQSTLIRDIQAIIELGDPPLRRKWLQEVTGTAEPSLWRFADGKADTATR